MIIAQIPHDGTTITVEVLSTFTTGDGRKLATVKALTGKPFTSWTHGGWAESETRNVRVDLLSNVAMSVDLPAAAAPVEILSETESVLS